jgi:hypothetical protein
VDTVGNDGLNESLESCISEDFVKPVSGTCRQERQRFIIAKYQEQRFKQGNSEQKQTNIVVVSPTCSTLNTSTKKNSPTATTTNHGMVEYVGVLNIVLVEGAHLVGMNISGKSDPYVIFRLGEQSITSKIIKHSINPHWNQKLMLSWDGISSLIGEIFDHNKIRDDRAMGTVIVEAETLKSLLDNTSEEIDVWQQVIMPREWAQNFGEHMVAGAEGVGKGFYTGITGVWKDPIKGAKEKGIGGFAKGVGTGVAGVVYRPIKGFGTMVKQTALGVRSKKNKQKEIEMVNGGSIHIRLSLVQF